MLTLLTLPALTLIKSLLTSADAADKGFVMLHCRQDLSTDGCVALTSELTLWLTLFPLYGYSRSCTRLSTRLSILTLRLDVVIKATPTSRYIHCYADTVMLLFEKKEKNRLFEELVCGASMDSAINIK